mmetsp:Transcript_77404/g.171382  ORF Transcript_77404/g.171382 Transcript_77404/m.171382 type:complete len:471 (+) Transcript_77404:3-1415(+)
MMLFTALLVLWTFYWLHDHSFHQGSLRKMGDGHITEPVGRWFGLTGVLFMSLALLPASKNSLWLQALGISWESSLWVHRKLGGATLVTALCHVLSFWIRYAELDVFPHDILALKLFYPLNGQAPTVPNADNWTITLMQLTAYPSFLAMGLLPFWRRKNWELFKYFHFFFLALVPATLFHATSAWYYMLGGLAFWLIDAALRFVGAAAPTPLLAVKAHAAEGGITELWFQKDFGEPGQYCFVNVPAVSAWEWHPFSLCSTPLDGAAQMCIKNMGPGTFTGKLHELAKKCAGGEGQPQANLIFNVDGPYGPALDVAGHERVLLFAGGIGITPIHSTFRMLSQLAARGELPGTLKLVKLVWVARSAAMFSILADSLRECLEAARPEGAPVFLLALYLDNPAEPHARADDMNLGLEVIVGRPSCASLYDEVVAESPGNGTTLVQACGPPPMAMAAEKAARSCPRLVFQSELFVL